MSRNLAPAGTYPPCQRRSRVYCFAVRQTERRRGATTFIKRNRTLLSTDPKLLYPGAFPMAEPQTTPQEGETTHLVKTSLIEQSGSNKAEQLDAHVATLRHKIEEANYLYYVQDDPTLTDAEYDQLMLELQRIEQEHPELQTPDSPTQRVGISPVQEVSQHRHPIPMLSLANARSEEELLGWHRRALNILPNATFAYVCELKIDGLAMALTYDNGRLTVAATRGDGLIGEDWTANVRTMRVMQHKLRGQQIPDRVEAQGEVYMATRSLET